MAFLASFGFAEWLIGIGAICSVIGTLLLGVRQGKEQLETKDQIITEQRNLVTGGEGYFFLRPSRVTGSNEVILLSEFRGNYPIYDVTIDVQEYDRVLQGQKYVYHPSSSYSVQMGTVHPLKSSSIFRQITLPANGTNQFGKRYFLKISSRNGFVEEDIYLRETVNGYAQAFKAVQFLPKYGDNVQGLSLDRIEARVKKIDSSFPMQDLDHLDGDSGWNVSYQFE
jgi:hypothetical protein